MSREESEKSSFDRELPVVLHTRVVTGTGGGPEKTILNSPRFLSNLGYRASCAYMHPPNDPGFEVLRERAKAWNAPLISIPDRGIRDLSVFQRLLQVCRDEKVAIWHAHDYKSNFIGLVLRRYWPMRLITTAHGWVKFTWRTPLYHWVDRFCQRRYDKVICVSQDIYEKCLKHGVKPDRCCWIDNAIDTMEFKRSQSISDAKTRWGIAPNRLLVGAVGRLSAEKGFDVLIQSVARLLERGVDVELWIAGDGDQRSSLEALIRKQKDPDRFRLLGHRHDTTDLFQAMDAFALSSLREGLPNVVLEAMALEVPVVATRIAGVPRVVRDQENGLLVEPSNVDELTSAIHRLLSDDTLRQQYSKNGRDLIEREFSFDKRMLKVSRLYDELLAK
jgi:glycosyltransferase involved in cell wall biosynthesis